MPPKKRADGAPPTPPAPGDKPAAKKTTAKKTTAKKTTAKKTTAKKTTPPSPPERGRATKGPTTAPERGKDTAAKPAARGADIPVPPQRRPIGTSDRPGVLARVAKPKPGATYHRAVLAEFIGAMLLAVLGGVLSPRKRADGQPTWVHLIVQLTAVAFVYFVLALLSASPRVGKIAAAFGLLVLLGVLLNSADAVRKTAAIFAPAKKPAAGAPSAGSSQPSGTGGQ